MSLLYLNKETGKIFFALNLTLGGPIEENKLIKHMIKYLLRKQKITRIKKNKT